MVIMEAQAQLQSLHESLRPTGPGALVIGSRYTEY